MVIGFHHIHLFCSAVEETALFFTDVFDAQVLHRGKLRGRSFIRIGLPGLAVNLTEVEKNAGTLESGMGKYGLDHFCLQVDSIEHALMRMRDKGVAVLAGPDVSDTGNKFLFVEGPNGIHIELLELK